MLTNQGSVLVTGGNEVTTSIDGAPVTPFAGVTLTDPTPGATDTVSIDISALQGRLADGPGYSGLVMTVESVIHSPVYVDLRYTLPAGTPAQVTAELDNIVFTPSGFGYPRTGLQIIALSSQPDNALVANPFFPDTTSETYVDAVPTRSVSLSPQVFYADGTFTLGGTATSVFGVRSVEISAVLGDGEVHDLGAAAVAPDGSFTFQDAIGAGSQGFITATLTDAAGGTDAAQASYALDGGLGPHGGAGRQTRYTADGSAETAVTRFRPDGSEIVNAMAGNQTFESWQFDTFDNHLAPSNTFVFDPGHGLDVVNGFQPEYGGQDVLSFAGADFGSTYDAQVAAMLSNTHDRAGGVVILDPTTQDKVYLSNVSKDQLTQNPAAVTFRA